jgi:multidrug efflux pump subunit AcrA (membrane-fusion protein)
MKFHIPQRHRKWLIVPPVLLGLSVVVFFFVFSEEPEKNSAEEEARKLSVITLERMDVTPRAVGYGTAAPARVWRAVARVSGRVIEVHPELESGAFLEKGETALRVDPRDYELAVRQTEANIAQSQAQLRELEAKEENARTSLDIAQNRLELLRSDLQDVRRLLEEGASTERELREMERSVLAQQQQVQDLENTLSLIPRQRAALEASLAVARANLELAQLDVERTTVEIPFDCRVVNAEIEADQYVQPGQQLFEADGIGMAEIDVQLAMQDIRRLLRGSTEGTLGSVANVRRLMRQSPLEATVRLAATEFPVTWPGQVLRARERLDARTRTAAFVVGVEDPYAQAIPGERPPLVRGMFCQVELRGPTLSDCVVIPRAALHGGQVYVLNEDNRLQFRDVEVLFKQDDIACLESGLGAGERLIIADPSPAIEDMLVEPVQDDERMERLKRQAREGAGN